MDAIWIYWTETCKTSSVVLASNYIQSISVKIQVYFHRMTLIGSNWTAHTQIWWRQTVATGYLCVFERDRGGYEGVKQGSAGAREIDPDMTCLWEHGLTPRTHTHTHTHTHTLSSSSWKRWRDGGRDKREMAWFAFTAEVVIKCVITSSDFLFLHSTDGRNTPHMLIIKRRVCVSVTWK